MKIFLIPVSLLVASTCVANAAVFYNISAYGHNMVSDNPGGDATLAEGAGVGFDAAVPHNKAGANWYTNAPGGFPSDYIVFNAGPEYIWFDLGADVPLNEISYWGYADTNANGMREFTLSFATDAEGGAALLGDESYGTSIAVTPSFVALQEPTLRQSFSFAEVDVRYVRVEAMSTYYNQPGAGLGGDRLGIGEIAFENNPIPEPGSLALIGLASAGLLFRRRRS